MSWITGLKLGFAALAAAGTLVAFLAQPASADTITYSLTSDFCSGTCGTGPFGIVTVSSISSTEVSVNLTLAPGEVFAQTGAGNALLFDLGGKPSITISNLSPTSPIFAYTGPNGHADGTGSWEYSISCTGCGNGTSPPTSSGPLNFDITVAGGITPSSFVQNGNGLFFATDIMGTNGKTGDVGAPTGTPVSSVPEPASLALFGTALAGLGLFGRRRRQS